jgi:hypothetical protein
VASNALNCSSLCIVILCPFQFSKLFPLNSHSVSAEFATTSASALHGHFSRASSRRGAEAEGDHLAVDGRRQLALPLGPGWRRRRPGRAHPREGRRPPADVSAGAVQGRPRRGAAEGRSVRGRLRTEGAVPPRPPLHHRGAKADGEGAAASPCRRGPSPSSPRATKRSRRSSRSKGRRTR